MDRRETLAQGVLGSAALLIRYLEGFSDATRTAQSSQIPNHAVWTLGHCALTVHRVAEMIDGLPLPHADFVRGDGSAGDATHFDTESVCFGSVPTPDDDQYPLLHRGVDIFQASCDRLARACRAVQDPDLDRTLAWHGGGQPTWALVQRVTFHNGTHAGQLVDLRRALDFDPIIRS